MKTLLTSVLLLICSLSFSNSIVVKDVKTKKTFELKVKDVTKYNFVDTYKIEGKTVKVTKIKY